MTTRDAPPTAGSVGGVAPGDRPHLPPVGTAGRRTDRDRSAPLGWLPWALLGLLVLTLLVAALLARSVGDGGQDRRELSGGSPSAVQGQAVEGAARGESVVADEGFGVGQAVSIAGWSARPAAHEQ